MKVLIKILKGILIAIVTLIICCFIAVEIYPRVHDIVEKTTAEDSRNWMESISDDRLLSEIVIPGVHDAGAKNVKLALFSKCQDENISELLDDGFRYLDVRVGVEYENDTPVISIYHGFVNCLNGDTILAKHLSLDSVIENSVDFLNENPTETIIFVVKYEHGDMEVSEFEKLLATYIDKNADAFLLTDSIPTMGEARGKIVLFRRYEDEANLGVTAGIYLNWSQQNEAPDEGLTYEEVDEENYTAFVQDRYKFDADTKWSVFEKTLENSEGLTINFLSTNGTATYGHPYKYAKILNQQLLNIDDNKINYGWIIVDFGNAELAEKIYRQN